MSSATVHFADASPADKRHLVSILIPIYNERPHIAHVIERILKAPMPADVDRELVVVDDGSTDETRVELAQFESHPSITLHYLSRNFGKGWAIREGLKIARGDIVVIQDGDREYDPDEIQLLVKPIQQGIARVVYGSRFRGTVQGMYLRYRIVNRLLAWAVRALFGARITDEATAYKAFDRSVLQSMSLNCVRFEFCPEVTAKVLRLGHTILEVPINYTARTKDEGKKVRIVDAFEAFWTLLRYRFWRAPPANDDGQSAGLRDNLEAIESMTNYRRWIHAIVAPHLSGDVFEAGCGNGNLATLIVGTPGVRRYIGVDHSESLCARLRTQLAADCPIEWDVRVMQLESTAMAQWVQRPFDAVVCLNVLEHIEDDRRMLATFHDMLKPGGQLLMLVPALPSLFGSIDQAVHHFRRYKRRELIDSVRSAGFRIGDARYFNCLGIAAWLWHGRILKLAVHRRADMKRWDRLVPLIQSVENHISLPVGLSVFVPAERV